MARTLGAQTTTPINTVPTVRQTTTLVTFDASYPTNGLAVSAADLGLSKVGSAVSTVSTAGANGPVNVFYDIANSKLKAFSATAEITNATDLSAVTVQIVATGI